MVGDVIVTTFPYTDLSDVAIRPAVVLANAGSRDWVVCQITSRRQSPYGSVAITQQDMQTGTLRNNSWVRTGRLHTLNERLFRNMVGRLSDAKQAEIQAAVRSLFSS